MAIHREPRRANLATIVGSSLAVVAAGSLLAFSSLAEQAGLEGLAAGGLQPAQPGRVSEGGHVITVPAPATAPPGDPRDALVQLVRDSEGRSRLQTVRRVETFTPEPRSRPERRERPDPKPTRPIEDAARVEVASTDDEVYEVDDDGPPYGHAYGHYKDKNKHKVPKPAKKHAPKDRSDEQPVYARSAHDDSGSKPPKAPKMQKVEKVKKAPGHSNGKAKGHSKHAHKGKGKGHSKH